MYNILIIEESKETSMLIKEILLKHVPKSRYLEAEDRREALDKLKTYDMDIIILSLTAPDRQGYDLLKELLHENYAADIPIIVNSKAKDMNGIKEALDMGASNYFVKSLSTEYMSMILSMVINSTLKYYEQKKELKTIRRMMDNEFKIAGHLQKSMLSLYTNKDTAEVEIKAYCRPAKNISSAIFDFKKINNKNWFFMVDSKGNKMIHLMISILLKAIFNEGINRSDSPGEIMTQMNTKLYELYPDMEVPFSSCILGKIENRILTYANAGFPNPIFLSENFYDENKFNSNWHMLGFDEDTYYIDYIHVLNEGDGLLMYTDGLYKNNDNEDFKPKDAITHIKDIYRRDRRLDDILKDTLGLFIDEECTEKEDFSVAILRMK